MSLTTLPLFITDVVDPSVQCGTYMVSIGAGHAAVKLVVRLLDILRTSVHELARMEYAHLSP